MVGFLNAHGTNPNIFDGQFQDLDFGIKGDYTGTAVRADGSFFLHGDYPFSSGSTRDCKTTPLKAAGEQLELDEDKSFMPSFSSNHEGPRQLTWTEAEDKWFRSHIYYGRNGGSKQTKWRSEDGKRARKSSRSDRHGLRKELALMRDIHANRYHEWEDFYLEWNPPAVLEFGVEVVGITDAEASWYEDIEPESYRFSYSDYADNGDDYDYPDLFEEEEKDFGPTLEEWLELDRITIESMLDKEAERFSPSFVGSQRSTLRYHVMETRRGKLKRKYGKSTSFLYRNGRPFAQSAAH